MYGSPHSDNMHSHYAPRENQLLLALPCVAFDFGPFVFWLVDDCDYPTPAPEPVPAHTGLSNAPYHSHNGSF